MVEKKNKKEGHWTRIGPLLKEVFEKQKQNVEKATYSCVKTSDYEAGEIIAKKIKDNNLV